MLYTGPTKVVKISKCGLYRLVKVRGRIHPLAIEEKKMDLLGKDA
jgi:hypothetical protein